MPDDLLGKRLGWREGVIPEEPDDSREVPQAGFCGLHFPVVNSGFIHPELLSHLRLEEAEVEPTLAEVVTYRN